MPPSGRRTRDPTQAHMRADNGKQEEADLGKADTQHRPPLRRQWETRVDLGEADTPSNTGTHVGTQGETRPQEGGRTIQHRHTCAEIMGDNWRQGEIRPDKPSNKGKQEGRQDLRKPTKENKKGDKQGETRPRKGGHIIQHVHTFGETIGDKLGDKGRQELGNADTPSNTGTPREGEHTIQHRHTYAGRQWGPRPGKANAPSKTCTRVPQRETMGDKGG